MYYKKFFLVTILIVFAMSSLYANHKGNPYQYLYENLPFKMPEVRKPIFPNHCVTINAFGGVPDGMTLNTHAFEKAINTLSAQGGGKIVIPSGVWLTGPIVLKSNINLHLERGALVVFTPDKEQYSIVKTFFQGLSAYRTQSPISGRNLENVAITGEGVINGTGDAWRPVKRSKVTDGHWKSIVSSGGMLMNKDYWVPFECVLKEEILSLQDKELSKEENNTIKTYLRPAMVSLIECKNILLEGVLFENSPSWNIHPLMCENLIVDGISVRNPSYAQNGDGLDIESCKNVIIINTTLDVGDDAICLKSGKDEEGRKRKVPTENVIVDNCRVFKGHGGFVVGSEMSGGVKNISVSNCQFIGTDVGLRFKSARGRGGVVENIHINNINMFDIVHEPLVFDLYYFTKKTNNIPNVDETTPIFRNIYINDIVARNANRAMLFNGLPEMNISNINIGNASILSKVGAEISESKNISLKGVSIIPNEGPALILKNVKNITVDNLFVPKTLKTVVKITGTNNREIRLPDNIDKNKIIQF